MMTALEAPTHSDASHFSRVVDKRLPVAQLLASAGSVPLSLGSVVEVEAFLVPTTAGETLSKGMSGRVNYLDPPMLVQWVRETIGDAELASGLGAIVADGRAFGLVVPELKQLLGQRVTQYRAALEDAEDTTVSVAE